MARLRICYVGDASSIHTQRWVEWFAVEHEVAVVSTTSGPGLDRYRVATLATQSLAGSRLLGWVAALRRVLKAQRPDVLHCHYINEAGWIGAASGWRPLVITAWGSDVYRARAESRAARVLNPWAVGRANFVTCDSADQARVLRSWGLPAQRVSVIGWGVDLQEFNPEVSGGAMRARLGIPAAARVVLSPRRWLQNSNLPAVIAAHARLPDSAYLLLKRPPGHDAGASVERAIASSPARDRIRVLGEIPPEELPALYAAADVVASLCTTDGTPASVLEAMALGRPVVALQNASLAEWVSEPGGQLVASLDSGVIAQALASFLAADGITQKAAAHNRAVIKARADRRAELGRMDEMYCRLAAPVDNGRGPDGR